MPNSTHPNYDDYLPVWQMCNDFTMGTRAVKAKGERYLPRPNPYDRTNEANARYQNYLKRAVFYEYSSKTVNQYLGLAFKQDPICEIDEQLNYLKTDANGVGISIYQLAQRGFKDLLVNGRFGIWVDYSQTKQLDKVNQKQTPKANVRLIYYDATSIINWRVDDSHLTMVMLSESINEYQGFKVKQVQQFRELGLDEQGLYVRVWRKGEKGFYIHSETTGLRKANGEVWRNIPFVIFGSQYNSFDNQDIPIEPLVHIEQGIYCNSADAENSRFLCGQVQPFMNVDNQTADYYNRLDEQGNKINQVRLGSETVLMLGENGSFGFAQAQSNTMATDGIVQKREIISELGYQLGQSGYAIKTATQAHNESQAQHSQASLCVANINEGMLNALKWAYQYAGVAGEPKFLIKQQFSPISVDTQVLALLNQLVDGGKLPKSVIWSKAKEFNLLDSELSDDDIIDLIESEYETNGIARTLQATSSE